MKKKLLLFISAFVAASSGNAQVNPNATQKVKNLYGNLKEVAWDSKGILFGQEFFNSFRWNSEPIDADVSDVKTVTGKHPAVLGQDFFYYNTKPKGEVDRHLAGVKKAYEQGCVITFDYHMPSKNHSSTTYENSDQYLMYNIGEQNDTYGEVSYLTGQLDKAITLINQLDFPIVVRLFHEMNGNWFWWGTKAFNTQESYKKMYQFAVDYMKARTNNVLFAWSPNFPFTEAYYPGDNYVDVVGVDMYDQGNPGYQTFDTMTAQLEQVSDFAWNHNKIPVFAELGNRIFSAPDQYPDWFYDINTKIQASNRGFKIAYMLTWINQSWGNPPYVPHSGSTAASKAGFNKFTDMTTTFMQPDAAARDMYDASLWTTKSTLDLRESKFDSNIAIYPVPVKEDYFNIILKESQNNNVNINITDILGHQVFDKNYNGINKIEIPVSSLGKGTYIVKISSDGQNFTRKIIRN